MCHSPPATSPKSLHHVLGISFSSYMLAIFFFFFFFFFFLLPTGKNMSIRQCEIQKNIEKLQVYRSLETKNCVFLALWP